MPEDNVWEKRWNTLKNWLAAEQDRNGYDDPHYHMMDKVEFAMDQIEKMEDDAQ
ncbi:hypothetical protein D3C71_765630 [compost metagenome]